MQEVRERVWKRRYVPMARVSIKSSLDTSILHGQVAHSSVISTTHESTSSLGEAGCLVIR